MLGARAPGNFNRRRAHCYYQTVSSVQSPADQGQPPELYWMSDKVNKTNMHLMIVSCHIKHDDEDMPTLVWVQFIDLCLHFDSINTS